MHRYYCYYAVGVMVEEHGQDVDELPLLYVMETGNRPVSVGVHY